MTKTSFKKLKSFPMYRIYEDGKIYSNYRNKYKAPEVSKNGYLRVQLIQDKTRKKFSIHKLVALLFLKNSNNFPVINHKDGNKTNNHYSNLEWCTWRHNNKHAYDVGLKCAKGENNGRAKLSKKEVKAIKTLYKKEKLPQWKIGQLFGISQQHVSAIVNNKYWSK
jgi:predicted XRE-type DNA-binding protein